MLGDRVKEILESAGVGLKQTKRSYVADCPRCQGDSKLYILKTSAQAKCMKCAEYFKPTTLISELTGMNTAEAATLVYDGGPVDLQKPVEIDFEEEFLPDAEGEEQDLKVISIDPLFIAPEGTPGMDYLQRRGVTDIELIKRHDIRYSAVMNGVVFIVRNAKGEPVGWQCRFITPWNPKLRMLSYEGMPKAKILYNYFEDKCEDNMIVAEGPFDCIKCDVPGHTSVATLGKGISPHQREMILKSRAQNIYLALDRDAANEVHELGLFLAEKKRVFRITPPEHRKDFGDCTMDEVIEAIARAEQIHADITARLELHFDGI